MNNIIKITSFFLLISVSEFAISGNYNAGKEKSQICAACHGVDGNSQIKMYPILAGQHKNYLVHALNEYRSGIRNNEIGRAHV